MILLILIISSAIAGDPTFFNKFDAEYPYIESITNLIHKYDVDSDLRFELSI
jgi:hypothetical protein